MPKPPSKTAAGQHKGATPEQADKLADVLADKPYGGVKSKPESKATSEAKAQNVSISLPPSLIIKLQDSAMLNKRSGSDLKTVSAIVKDALEKAGY